MREGLAGTESSRSAAAPVEDDMRLAQAVARRDRKATAEFVSRYADDLFSYLVRRLSPRADLAEDLLQEVFLAAWESVDRFQGHSPLRSWLFGIARHKVEAHYRRQLRAPTSLEEDDAVSNNSFAENPVLDEQLDQELLEARTRETLDALPEHYRAALLWRYWERRSAEEMAAATGRSVKAIERLLARAREKFKRCWRQSARSTGKEVPS